MTITIVNLALEGRFDKRTYTTFTQVYGLAAPVDHDQWLQSFKAAQGAERTRNKCLTIAMCWEFVTWPNEKENIHRR